MTTTTLIDDIHKRVGLCFGANAMAFDRLFRGNSQEAAYWMAAVRERKEMQAALDTAAMLIAERDAELEDRRAVEKESGELSMGLGEAKK